MVSVASRASSSGATIELYQVAVTRVDFVDELSFDRLGRWHGPRASAGRRGSRHRGARGWRGSVLPLLLLGGVLSVAVTLSGASTNHTGPGLGALAAALVAIAGSVTSGPAVPAETGSLDNSGPRGALSTQWAMVTGDMPRDTSLTWCQ